MSGNKTGGHSPLSLISRRGQEAQGLDVHKNQQSRENVLVIAWYSYILHVWVGPDAGAMHTVTNINNTIIIYTSPNNTRIVSYIIHTHILQ